MAGDILRKTGALGQKLDERLPMLTGELTGLESIKPFLSNNVVSINKKIILRF